jgi:two-component system phosphate regulon sensor histidine kinase PhoR
MCSTKSWICSWEQHPGIQAATERFGVVAGAGPEPHAAIIRAPLRARLCDARAVEAWLAAIAAVIALVVVAALAARDRRAIGAIRTTVGVRSDGDPVAAVRDLAARAEQLEAGRAHDAQDRDAFVDALSQGVLTIDDGSRIVGANAAAHALLDQAPGALLGRTLIEAFIDTQVEAVAHAALEIGSATGEVAVAGADGPKLVLRARRAPSGGLWIVMEDVSELRRLQQIRAEFIDNLSHELRTPLTTVSLLAETLNREAEAAGDSVPARMRDRIGKIEIETSHLVQMVNELLDLSRIESGGARGVVDLLDLGQVANESVERLRLFADRQGVTFVVDVPAAVPAVQGDEQRLGQVLVNLLHNAVKFTERGRIVVGARAALGAVELTVHDTGIGIPPEAQTLIFEPFRQADRNVHSRFGGAGLGLYIVRRLLDLLGGSIRLASELGVGSTFSLRLPIDARQLRIREMTRRNAA